MLLPLKWLKDYIKIDLSLKKLAELLMFSSFEVEEMKEGNVLDIDVTPNRSDCFSILGLAREVGTLTNQKVNFPKMKFNESKTKAVDVLNVKVENKKLCPQYCARVIKDVKVGPSPKWLVERLELMGVKSINNIVDITNFVLFELGQPLHAFDSRKLKTENRKQRILVRNARRGERILALDENKYDLDESMLIIADSKKPIAIAGIVGGEETAVSKKTKDVILESAIFDAKSVRFTSRKLGARTESSIRFERSFDPALTEQAINRAADLIVKLAGGEVLKDIVRVGKISSVKKIIKISVEEINSLIGVDIPGEKIVKLLKLLNCSVKKQGKNLNVTLPSYRLDLNLPADIIEEVARIYGYNKLPDKYLVGELIPPQKDELLEAEKIIRETILRMGFDEVYNSSFYGEKELEWVEGILNFPRSSAIAPTVPSGHPEGVPRSSASIENPMSPEEKYFRASLLPGLFKNIELNENNFDEIRVFEIGKVYYYNGKEETHVAGIISLKGKDYNIYRQIKGMWSKISFDQGNIGVETTRFKNPVAYFEFKIPSSISTKISFKPLPKFPGITRDLSIVVPKQVKWSQIEEIVKKESGNLLESIELFDIYVSPKLISPGLKDSLAFHLHFLHSKRTLKNEEIDTIIINIIQRLETKLGAKVRK